ncbi:MAG: polysaccharide biosynthesis/export family protein, partial [Verrucomicrobiia bacterium]
MRNFTGKTIQTGGCLLPRLAVFALGIVTLTIVTGCQTGPAEFETPPSAVTNSLRLVIPEAVTNVTNVFTPTPSAPATYTLREGDILKISFPGSPNLNSIQQIRSDGKINLPLIGEVNAAGLTTEELQKKLMDSYASQLSPDEVTVEVQSSSFPVYVTGAVLRPGKISSDHPITALEAIMEAGGFD